MRKRILFATMLITMMSLQGCSCSKSDAPVVTPAITSKAPTATPVAETTTTPVAETTATPVVDAKVEITKAPAVETTTTPEVTEVTTAPAAEATATPEVPEVTEAPEVKPTEAPATEVKATPVPTATPKPTKAPTPTATPKPTEAPVPTLAPYQNPKRVEPSSKLEFEMGWFGGSAISVLSPDSVLGWSIANADLPIETGRYEQPRYYDVDNYNYWKSKGVKAFVSFDYYFDVNGQMVLPPSAKINEEDNTVWLDSDKMWIPICSVYEVYDIYTEICERRREEESIARLDAYGLEIGGVYFEASENVTGGIDRTAFIIWKRDDRDYISAEVHVGNDWELEVLEECIPEVITSEDEFLQCINIAIEKNSETYISGVICKTVKD